MQIHIFTAACIFFEIREVGFNSFPTPFKMGKTTRVYLHYFIDITVSSALQPVGSRSPCNANSRILHCWCASTHQLRSPWLPLTWQVGIAAVPQGNSKAGWWTSGLPDVTDSSAPYLTQRWDYNQEQNLPLLWVKAMWMQQEDAFAAGSNQLPQIWICSHYESPCRSDLIVNTESADLFPRVKQLVQQLFIPNKLTLLLNTYFHQAENINVTWWKAISML